MYLQDDVMQVEYLQEYESTFLTKSQFKRIKSRLILLHILIVITAMLFLQKRKAVINNHQMKKKILMKYETMM